MNFTLQHEITVKIHRKNSYCPGDIFKIDPRFLTRKSETPGKELHLIIDDVLNKKNKDNLVKI